MNSAAIFPMNMIRLCVDGYENDLTGRVYSKLMLVPLMFSGCGGLLLRMDDIFEQAGFPQAFQMRRTFSGPEKPKGGIRIPEQMMDDEEMERQNGDCRTFDIIVQSRRQSGWQGMLMDPERTSMRKFRSEMELLRCLCQELGEPFGEADEAFLL